MSSRAQSPHPRRKLVPARRETNRLEILLPSADVESIRVVANLTGQSTLTAVVRDALKAYTWMVIEQRRNRRVISEDRERGDRIELMPLLRVTELPAANQ